MVLLLFYSKVLESIFHDNGIKQFLTEGYALLEESSHIILKLPKEFVLDMLGEIKE